MADPAASIVIATRDRPALLRDCLNALASQTTPRPFELIVVDDGSEPPLRDGDVAVVPGVTVLRGAGEGPGRARNRGLAVARAPVVVFTDDDTLPDPAWLEAALAHLDSNPHDVGVEGPIASLPYDSLHAYSLEVSAPGAYFTANVAYRREVLTQLGGFDPGFPHPHGEDLDLAYRALAIGPIGWAQEMRVRHVPRQASLGQIVRRARYAPSELVLLERHRWRYGRGARLPPLAFVLANVTRHWFGIARREGAPLLVRPDRLARWTAMFAGQLAVAATVTARALLAKRRLPSAQEGRVEL